MLASPPAQFAFSHPYLLTMVIIVVVFVWPTYRSMKKEEAEARRLQEQAIAEGTHEPVSIRPHIDLSRCIGSAACIHACPEQKIIQVIDGVAQIVMGSHCVGHGACERACPLNAITLVFGSERRGIELPVVQPDFQTNVAGLYIAGELGGMGLVANAVEQGVQAMMGIEATLQPAASQVYDVVIVGAGPAGFAAGLYAQQKKLKYLLIEQDEFGGAIRHYPRQKLVMARPIAFPGFGTVKLKTIRKEELIELFEQIMEKTGLQVSCPERVERISPASELGFVVTTQKREIRSQQVLICVGRRGTPRTLGVPGEEQEKVAYRLIDAELYDHKHILVVGGGDSAVEAACSLSEQPGNKVWLSYRKSVINRPKAANVERLKQATQQERVTLVLESTVSRIELDRVAIDQKGEQIVLPNDFVFVFAGGILPTSFLEKAGIRLQTHYGKRIEDRA